MESAHTSEYEEHVQTTPPAFQASDVSREVLGLPPTPPTLTNSDVAAPRKESLASNHEFAEAVRNALRAKVSGTVTPTGTNQPPQTPDPSPPGQRSGSIPPITRATSPSPFAQHVAPPYDIASSRAESFQTARENMDSRQTSMANTPLVENPPVVDWLKRNNSMSLKNGARRTLSGSTHQTPPVEASAHTPGTDGAPIFFTPRPTSMAMYDLEFSDDNLEAQLRSLKLVSDSPLLRRKLRAAAAHDSTVKTVPSSRLVLSSTHITEHTTHDLHVSLEAVIESAHNDDEQFVPLETIQSSTPTVSLVEIQASPSLLANEASTENDISSDLVEELGQPGHEELHAMETSESEPLAAAEPLLSTEAANDLVYREIREDNVKRHSGVYNGGPVRVNVIVPKPGPERTLKRRSKYQTLREHSSVSASPQQTVIASPQLARPQKSNAVNKTAPEDDARAQQVPTSSAPYHSPAITKTVNSHAPVIQERVVQSRATLVQDVVKHAKLRRAAANDAAWQATNKATAVSNLHPLATGQNIKSPQISHRRKSSSASRRSGKPTFSSPADSDHTLRHFSREAQLENNSHVRRTSLASYASDISATRPTDARFLQPIATPMSTSQFSDRSDVELCEAQGVTIYPHHNESVLVLQHGSLPTSRDNTSSRSSDMHFPVALPRIGLGVQLRPVSTPRIHVPDDEKHSPLTNPRAAPAPPAFRVIPPTPGEVDRQLIHGTNADDGEGLKPSTGLPQRNLSLTQRARRYSESYILPIFARSSSVRRRQGVGSPSRDGRPSHLSPFWRPRYFWEEYDSSDDEDECDDSTRGKSKTPLAGNKVAGSQQAKPFLPRNMSVRMPGFRGAGGFLVGNSLGLERHGSNNRRPYVVRQRSAEEISRRRHSRRSMLPSLGFAKSQITPLHLRKHWNKLRLDWAERASERRREVLRGQIQHTR